MKARLQKMKRLPERWGLQRIIFFGYITTWINTICDKYASLAQTILPLEFFLQIKKNYWTGYYHYYTLFVVTPYLARIWGSPKFFQELSPQTPSRACYPLLAHRWYCGLNLTRSSIAIPGFSFDSVSIVKQKLQCKDPWHLVPEFARGFFLGDFKNTSWVKVVTQTRDMLYKDSLSYLWGISQAMFSGTRIWEQGIILPSIQFFQAYYWETSVLFKNYKGEISIPRPISFAIVP